MSRHIQLLVQQIAARCVLEECAPEELALPPGILNKVIEVYQARLVRGIGYAIKVSLEDLREKSSGA